MMGYYRVSDARSPFHPLLAVLAFLAMLAVAVLARA
jgi:hypothetical protein